MTGYYDLILGLIPASFLGTAGLLHVAGFGLMSALPVAGLISVLLVAHALFVNGPVDATAPQQSSNFNPGGAD